MEKIVILMDNKYLVELKKVIVGFLKNEEVKVLLFGSRARKDNYPTSDVDIGIIPGGTIDKKKLILLKEKVENLNLPYKIEIVNLEEVSPIFRKEALKDAIVWKD